MVRHDVINLGAGALRGKTAERLLLSDSVSAICVNLRYVIILMLY
jgi:hypothetical protein